MLGVIGGPLVFASATVVLLGAFEQTGTHFIFYLPEIAWEASLGIWLMAKGSRPFSHPHLKSSAPLLDPPAGQRSRRAIARG